MEVYPISITQPEWGLFTSKVQDFFGISPTRGLDREGIELSDPAAFYACLDLKNQPLEMLRNMPSLEARHVHLGIIAKLATQELLDIVTELDSISKLVYSVPDKRSTESVVIMTASIYSWFVNIRFYCKESCRNKSLKKFLSAVYVIMYQTRYREMFTELKKESLADGIIHFKRDKKWK